jgi:Domain of unknown function (DUF397)
MSETPADEPLQWVKSTRSAGNGECVEVARTATGVAVRDSKDQHGPTLRFNPQAWQGFIREVRSGAFDHPGAS